MSNKPAKHSERKKRIKSDEKQSSAARLNSGWGSPRRSNPSRSVFPGRHLIVCEGTKTEPNYFEAIKNRINRKYGGEWLEVKGAGKNTLSLYEHAREYIEDSPVEFSHVWLVYDKDGFPSRNFNATAQKCERKDLFGSQFHAVWTNEAFELWYILHFEYLQSALSRSDYANKITTYLEGLHHRAYAKNDLGMFELLLLYIETAVHNAKKLEELCRGKTPSESNPCTTVHHLIEELRPYI